MAIYTLTIVDTLKIQGFIFGSNRLRENLGASQLVYKTTSDWLRDALKACVGEAHNVREDYSLDPEKFITDTNTLEAEVVFAGGGNALLLFREHSKAHSFVQSLSRTLLTHAPGLDIVAAHIDFDWDKKAIGGDPTNPTTDSPGILAQLMELLNQTKQQRLASTPILGQSVSLECRSTGLPAVCSEELFSNEPAQILSADILAKLNKDIRKEAKNRFIALLPENARFPNFVVRDDFDDLGRTEDDQSYIAVVHADGNGMGQRFQQALNQFSQSEQNRDCISVLRGLSQAVDQAGRRAIRHTAERLVEGMKLPEMRDFVTGLKTIARHDIPKDYGVIDPNIEKVHVLPFRLIIAGGDDITFVCDGRLGLHMAAAYLQEWEQAMHVELELLKSTLEDQKIELDTQHEGHIFEPATACAGIAIVKTHYPFARAYELSTSLCDKAKDAIKRKASALDWHFATSGLSGSLKAIRDQEYNVKDGSMLMRPISLSKTSILDEQWQVWSEFKKLVYIFKGQLKVAQIDKHTIPNEEGAIYAHRNRVKALREALRHGAATTKRFMATYRLKPLPFIDKSHDDVHHTGWKNKHCAYFDAIEIMDFFLPVADDRELN